MNIPIKNIYYMLSYAFKVLQEGKYKKLSDEHFDRIEDLFAEILSICLASQIKQGLVKDYKIVIEPLTSPHGKIDFAKTIMGRHLTNKRVVCSYDEYSEDCELNQIIKATAEKLLLNKDVAEVRKQRLRSLLGFFSQVSCIDLHTVQWNKRFNRNNQTYRMIIYICHWLYRKSIISEKKDDSRIKEFKDQNLCRLYEKFLFNYYRKEHHKLSVEASHVDWQLDAGSEKDMLPDMRTDITLTLGNRILIMDAKFYNHETQVHFDSVTHHSNNLYQIFTYVKNKAWEVKEHNKTVSGMLLYAKTKDNIVLNHRYKMSGNDICIKNLDLDEDFTVIRKNLDQIVQDELYQHNTKTNPGSRPG